jgi:DNA polymerase II small subunit/DNA polymerase delta subunit B
MTKHFTNRYETLKKYLSSRLELVNLISVNKITSKTKKFSLIVMVKEKNDRSLLVEDSTGEATVYVQEEAVGQVVPDEVIGIVCEKENDTINVKKIIFPDIPLKRDVARTEKEAYAFFISDMFLNQVNNTKKILDKINSIKDKLYVFVLGNVSSQKEDIINFFNNLPKNASKIFLKGDIDPEINMEDVTIFSSPTLVKIENKILVLVCSGKIFSEYKKIWKEQSSEKIMLNLLRKRHLSPVFDFNKKISEEDSYIIDIVPDIFVSSNFDKPGVINYKGTTIASNGSFLSEPIYWLINLKTREIIKMDFT